MASLLKRAKSAAMTTVFRQLFKSKSARRMALRQLFSEHLSQSLAIAQFDDHTFIVDPRDHMIAFHLLSGTPWQLETFQAVVSTLRAHRALRPGTVFADIGANIGTQTVYALQSGAFTSAIAVEPDPHNFDLLTRNVEINGLTGRVDLVRKAASRAPGRAVLRTDPQNFGAHSVSLREGKEGTVAVELARFDDIASAHDIGLIWIDVEGHETDALRGMPRLLERGIPICIECLPGSTAFDVLGRHYSMYAPIKALDRGEAPRPIGEFRSVVDDILFFNPGT